MSTFRYRQNIDCLTSDQLHDLREAIAAMYDLPPEDENSFEKIAGLHGQPWPGYCIHGIPGFLTWHRAYMEVFEKALRCFNHSISLPFWDWSSGPSTGVPSACSTATYVNRDGDTVPNPLYAGPLPGGMTTARRSDIDTTTFDAMATLAQDALTEPTFSSFQSSLSGPHGWVHGNVGGQMASVPYAGFDPIFFLHHCNVDRVWALWQTTHSGPLPANEASLELEPFNKSYSGDWKTGADFATTVQLGYRYKSFCLYLLPPWDLWDVFKIHIDPKWFKQGIKSANLVLKSNRMPARSMEIRVFINQPRASAKTATRGNPHFAGSLGMFGMTAGDEEPVQMKRRPNERFDLALNISRTLVEQHASGEEVSIKLVPVGIDGQAVPPDKANLEGIDILVD